MKNIVLATALVISPLVASAQAATPARVAELSAHRIDRLVTTGKIDASFGKKLETVEVSVAGPAPIAYRSLVSQTAPAKGAPMQLELMFDASAKPLSFKVLPGGVAGPDPVYNGGADAVGLFENSMHAVLDKATDPTIAPFYNGLTTVTLKKGKLNGMDVARATVTSSLSPDKLNVYLMLDGMLMSTEITK